jgi:hypothetical protein
MHCAFCTRNVWRCAQCDEVMARSEREAHEQEVHAEVACECGEVMQKRALKRHKAEACMLKQVACESFSDDVSPAAACLATHATYSWRSAAFIGPIGAATRRAVVVAPYGAGAHA